MTTLSSTDPKSEHSEDAAITAYGPPFDDTDADVILRTSDRVDFLVYKVILSKASPVFKTVFSLPQPVNAANTPQDSLPIVDLTESSKVLATLLSVIYPPTSPLKPSNGPLSLDDFISLLDMARKYEMEAISRHFIDCTDSKVLRDNPLEAFCAAYVRQLGEAAQIAARASLKRPLNLDEIGEKLQYKDCWHGPALHKLWKYHRACSAAAIKSISSHSFTWFMPAQVTSASANCCCNKEQYTPGPKRNAWFANTSWHGYVDRALAALKDHPSSKAVANKGIIQSSYQAWMCDECRQRLPEFSRMLGEEVERVVSDVRGFSRLF
jgi:hypothetical protein